MNQNQQSLNSMFPTRRLSSGKTRHIANPLASLLIAFLIRRNVTKKRRVLSWSILAILWLTVTILDGITLSKWNAFCADTGASIQALSVETTTRGMGEYDLLNHVACSTGIYAFLLTILGIATVGTLIGVFK